MTASTDGHHPSGAEGGHGREKPERGLGRRTFLSAGVLAGGASLPIAAAVRSAAASSGPGLPETASAASGQTRQLTVAEYVVERLAALGIGHVFGVPGDYAFPFDNAVEASDRVAWGYHDLPAAFGCTGWYTARVTTVGELDAALAAASRHDNGCYLEIMLGRTDIPASLPDAVLDTLYQTAPAGPALPAITSAAAADVVNGGGQLS